MKKLYTVTEQLLEDKGHGWQGATEADTLLEIDDYHEALEEYLSRVELEQNTGEEDKEAICIELVKDTTRLDGEVIESTALIHKYIKKGV